MNIFYLDPDPKICAQYHVDKHVVKMILESCQLLSTAHRVLDGEQFTDKTANNRNIQRWRLTNNLLENSLYKATHPNHPSAIWARQSDMNYIWLCNLLIACCKEYTYRYGKTHKVERDGLCFVLLKNIPTNIPKSNFTEPTPAMPDEVKIPGDSLASYKNYYIKNKSHLAKWKYRKTPEWYNAIV